ncbi:hypothetical protein CM49_06174 [Paenibacillus sp. P1XP2]|nr:hypothetical protein CM49_06174 [Paenibacillus sp. P1XP2]
MIFKDLASPPSQNGHEMDTNYPWPAMNAAISLTANGKKKNAASSGARVSRKSNGLFDTLFFIWGIISFKMALLKVNVDI